MHVTKKLKKLIVFIPNLESKHLFFNVGMRFFFIIHEHLNFEKQLKHVDNLKNSDYQ